MKRRPGLWYLFGSAALLLAAILCYVLHDTTVEIEEPLTVHRLARVSPDYSGVVIPPNIAPLNFVVTERGEKYHVNISAPHGETIDLLSSSPRVVIPMAKWKRLLQANRGGSLMVHVHVKDRDGRWTAFEPIVNTIASEDVDRFLVYRVLHKFNMVQEDIGIHQRDLENFDESLLMHSKSIHNGCMNCHTFSRNSPSNMVMHVRTAGGGMLLIRDGSITKVDTRTEFNSTPAKYISLHPSGKLAAFSTNDLTQFFHALGERLDVFEVKSDLALYLFDTNTVTTTPDISRSDRHETWPSWSPDGRYLYFSSAPALPTLRWKDVRYDLMRISYDVEKDAWGKPETVLSAGETGLSITQPRISPDGRFLLLCMSEWGSFPVWQESADLYLMDLKTGKYNRLAINSDHSDSWHSWSKNSRWIVFSSRRPDGALARPYFSHIDETGAASKPLVLPQKDPAFYDSFLKTYNLPEFVTERVPFTQRELVGVVRSAPVLKAKLDPRVKPPVKVEPPVEESQPKASHIE